MWNSPPPPAPNCIFISNIWVVFKVVGLKSNIKTSVDSSILNDRRSIVLTPSLRATVS